MSSGKPKPEVEDPKLCDPPHKHHYFVLIPINSRSETWAVFRPIFPPFKSHPFLKKMGIESDQNGIRSELESTQVPNLVTIIASSFERPVKSVRIIPTISFYPNLSSIIIAVHPPFLPKYVLVYKEMHQLTHPR